MSKPTIPSICVLAALVAALAGCQTPPRQDEAQAGGGAVPVRSGEAEAREPVAAARAPAAPAARTETPARESKARERAAPALQDEAGVAFRKADVAAIRDYYGQGRQPDAPSGPVTKPRRGEAYPFGYTWRALPGDLERRLSPLPRGYVRVLVGSEVAILNVQTRVVADLVDDLRGAPQATEAPGRAHPDKASPYFSAADIARIRDYYGEGRGLGKTAGRIAKLRRGETYPFGHTWRALPEELEGRLSPLPKGLVRVIVGTDIGVIDLRSRVVVDILKNPAA
ncbi:MAG: hypothetical protein PHS77_11730 [Gallionellaceae bacterium]|nr:hypothetical protein [Gallionellaceae bacterium]